MIFSIFAFTRGIGNITSGPISEALLSYNTMQGAAGAYGLNNYVCFSLWFVWETLLTQIF